jgi:hypothetical protein
MLNFNLIMKRFLLLICSVFLLGFNAFSQQVNHTISPISIDCVVAQDLRYNAGGILIDESFTGVYVRSRSKPESKLYAPIKMQANGTTVMLTGARGSSAVFSIGKVPQFADVDALFAYLNGCLNSGGGSGAAVDVTVDAIPNLPATTNAQNGFEEVAANITALDLIQASLINLSGMPVLSDNLGSFTGNIIPNNVDNRQAFQAIETAVEAIAGGASDGVATGAVYDPGTKTLTTSVAAPGTNYATDLSSVANVSELGQYNDFIMTGQSRAVVANPEGPYEIKYQGDRVKVWQNLTDEFETATPLNNAFPNGGGNSAQWVIAQQWAIDEPMDTIRYMWSATGTRGVGCWTVEPGDQGPSGTDNECLINLLAELDAMPADFSAKVIFVQQGEYDNNTDNEWLQKWAGVLENLRTHARIDDNASMVFSPFIETMTDTPWKQIDSLLNGTANIGVLPIFASDERLYDNDLGITNHPNNYAYTLTGQAMYRTYKDQTYHRPSRLEDLFEGFPRRGLINPAFNGFVPTYNSTSGVMELLAPAGDMLLASGQTITGTKTFGTAGNVGKLRIAGLTSGALTLDAPAVAGTGTVTLPLSGALASLNLQQIFTARQTFGASGTTAGIRLSGVSSHPSSPAAGGIWYRTDLQQLFYRGVSTNFGIARTTDLPTLTSQLTNDSNFLTSETDASVTNEGSLTVGAGGGNSATIVSNTSGSTPVTIVGGAGTTVTENVGTNEITIAVSGGGGGGVLYAANGTITGGVGDSQTVVFTPGFDLDGTEVVTVSVAEIVSGSIDNAEKLFTMSVDTIGDTVTVSAGATLESGDVLKAHITIH